LLRFIDDLIENKVWKKNKKIIFLTKL
jgi:hypothetical protein